MTKAITLSVRDGLNYGERQVSISPGVPKSDDGKGRHDLRHSILYPVNVGQFVCPGKDFQILFLGGPNPLGLIHFFEKQYGRNLCYGIGAQSAILITDATAEPFEISSAPDYAPITVHEQWTVIDGRLNSCDFDVLNEAVGVTNPLRIPDEGLDPTTVLTVSELSLNLARALRFARNFAPETTRDLEAAVADAQLTLNEAVELRRAIREGMVSKAPIEQLNEIKRELDHDLERLVQMNSALVYLTTQAFHGASPILNNTPLVSYQSVLGTGTAWRAVARMARTLFTALNKRRLPPALARVLLHGPNPSTGEENGGSFNRRIVHFSGRLGFGETDVTITVPSQVIGLCSTAEWSIVTLSHEVLHAYVKRIIAALLVVERPGQGILNGTKGLEWHALNISKWISIWGKQGEVNGTKDAPSILRYHIFRFAIAYQSAETEYGMRVQAGLSGLPETLAISASTNPQRLIEIYDAHSKLIEEIMVHVLDLIYFYGKDVELFVESLWVTWASVPSVLGKLEHYILRTLISLLAVFDGKGYTPLTRSIEVLASAMEKLTKLPEYHAVAQSVLEMLDKDGFKMRVDLIIPAAHTFVRTIVETCADPDVVEAVFGEGDPLVDADGECILEDGVFDATEVSNPLLLVLSILRRRLHAFSDYHDDFETISRESAWLLLAIASPPPEIS